MLAGDELQIEIEPLAQRPRHPANKPAVEASDRPHGRRVRAAERGHRDRRSRRGDDVPGTPGAWGSRRRGPPRARGADRGARPGRPARPDPAGRADRPARGDRSSAGRRSVHSRRRPNSPADGCLGRLARPRPREDAGGRARRRARGPGRLSRCRLGRACRAVGHGGDVRVRGRRAGFRRGVLGRGWARRGAPFREDGLPRDARSIVAARALGPDSFTATTPTSTR